MVLGEFGEVAVERLDRIILPVAFGIADAAERQFPGREQFGLVAGRMLDVATALDHQHLQARLGQLLGRPAAGDPRPDDDRIEILHHPNSTAVQSLEKA